MKRMTKEEEIEYFKIFLYKIEKAFYHSARNSYRICFSLYDKECCECAMKLILELFVEKTKKLNYIVKKETNEDRKKDLLFIWRIYQNRMLDFKRMLKDTHTEIRKTEEIEIR